LNLSDIRRILNDSGLQLTKSLGQNFMHDGNQLRRIVKVAELEANDKVLEIGPGLGPLTELLLEQVPEGMVLAIEKDARLLEILRKRFNLEPETTTVPASEGAGHASRPALQLIHDDALDYLRQRQRSWDGWKLVANLPYSVASPILVELALAPLGPDRLVATLQLEVARRLMAAPGKSDYGVLTLLIQLNYAPAAWFKVPASCFFPQPDVDSACVCLVRRARPLLAPEYRETFVRIVKRSFSQRRKMMLKLLKEEWPAAAVEEAFAETQLAPGARAESVALDQFVTLAAKLYDK
jgi:16S rRNA (adenine1518-N6/adenine1519-N6)-dimethyltransferase